MDDSIFKNIEHKQLEYLELLQKFSKKVGESRVDINSKNISYQYAMLLAQEYTKLVDYIRTVAKDELNAYYADKETLKEDMDIIKYCELYKKK